MNQSNDPRNRTHGAPGTSSPNARPTGAPPSRPNGQGQYPPRTGAPRPTPQGGGQTPAHRPPQSGAPNGTRAERRQKQRTTLFAIFVVIALIMLLLVVLIFSELKISIDDLNDKKGDVTTTTPAATSDSAATSEPKSDMAMLTVQKTQADMAVGELIQVDADHAYVFPSTTSHLESLYGVFPLRQTCSMDKLALAAFKNWMTAFGQEFSANDLIINWAYRSKEDQQKQYEAYAKDYPGYTESQIRELLRGIVDEPGYSEHHIGTCVDLKIKTDGSNKALETNPTYYAWLTENCWRYGFTFRSPSNGSKSPSDSYNPYYFRYIGVPHAYYIFANDTCLENYLDTLREKTTPSGEHLSITLDDGSEYEVYYVAATGNVTDVPVPKDYPYTVSGDNAGGFIVTVEVK